jgi:DEAD/DEAH box helicase domain-containing protein
MNKIMALDIETTNFSWEIGGWGNKNMFDTSVVATWDGDEAHIFSKEDISVEGATMHPLHPKTLGNHITNHIEKGGQILGHNIMGFDFPVLKESLDCWAIGDVMSKSENIIDTKNLVAKAAIGNKIETSLQSLSIHTLGMQKSMSSIDAPTAWRNGKYNEVAEYCLKDSKLTFDLYMYGKDNGLIKSRSLDTGAIIDITVEW